MPNIICKNCLQGSLGLDFLLAVDFYKFFLRKAHSRHFIRNDLSRQIRPYVLQGGQLILSDIEKNDPSVARWKIVWEKVH